MSTACDENGARSSSGSSRDMIVVFSLTPLVHLELFKFLLASNGSREASMSLGSRQAIATKSHWQKWLCGISLREAINALLAEG